MSLPFKFADKVAAHHRSFKILSPLNGKTPKGEASGYVTAILYLSPHTLIAPKTLCPHSTEACRSSCLYTAGRGVFERVRLARERRTRQFVENTMEFLDALIHEIDVLQTSAWLEGKTLAIRLNGTSDVRWEFVTDRSGRTLFERFPYATWYDYTRTPTRHRHVPPAWRLVWSLADAPLSEAFEHLRVGQSVAAIVPPEEKAAAPAFIRVGDRHVQIIDGEEDDLRFLDPPGALVLLKPKGALLRNHRHGGAVLDHPMVRWNLLESLAAMNEIAA